MNDILIMIASYKDPDLYPTVCNALEMAKYPERIHFAICYQDDVTKPYYEQLKEIHNLKMIVVSPKESRGTGWARHLLFELIENEEYTFQIDSHTRFTKGWDEKLIDVLLSCNDDKACLSMYSYMINGYYEYIEALENNEPIKQAGYTLAADYFLPEGVPLLFHGSEIEGRDKPYKGAFISGHLLFAKSQMFKDVPYDPQIYFYGEEISYAVRLWTNGYNIYHPHEQIIFHEFDDMAYRKVKLRPFHKEEHNSYLFDFLSKRHTANILTDSQEITSSFKYGLGSIRTIKEYEAYSGVDFKNRTLKIKAVAGMYDDYEGVLYSPAMNRELDWKRDMAEEIIARIPEDIFATRYNEDK